ncbi:DUF2523 family protein [Xanthomonas campestris]|uniref:DUF2523 family protein n=1 Tax=Xanthomonas campestris TaxID=339 RepID=UPI0023678680|nr:DUF2523 family protein [Xanthomonas campestris]MEA9838961.1 DUF2523 family protein [Xanthomonas campestris pv. raphani]WDJ20089.1 DUF2523 domain-containing protein [Xanthomonas campestris pv. raphani]
MDAILTKLSGLLITGLKLGAAGIVGRVMAGLGMTWVNFTYSLPAIKSWLSSKFAGLPDNVTTILSASGIDIFMTLIISAIVARLGMRTVVTSLNALQGLIGQEQGT